MHAHLESKPISTFISFCRGMILNHLVPVYLI